MSQNPFPAAGPPTATGKGFLGGTIAAIMPGAADQYNSLRTDLGYIIGQNWDKGDEYSQNFTSEVKNAFADNRDRFLTGSDPEEPFQGSLVDELWGRVPDVSFNPNGGSAKRRN
jgi:hypothetical protein